MNVACNEQRKKDNGDQAEVTYWCSVYFKESSKMLEYLKKVSVYMRADPVGFLLL